MVTGVPPAVCEKAKRLERLIVRVGAGDLLEQACAELELHVGPEDLSRLQQRYLEGGQTPEVLIDGRYGHSQKIGAVQLEWMCARKHEDEMLTGGQLASGMAERFGVSVSVSQVNRVLAAVGLSRPCGRPSQRGADVVVLTDGSDEPLDNAGIWFR